MILLLSPGRSSENSSGGSYAANEYGAGRGDSGSYPEGQTTFFCGRLDNLTGIRSPSPNPPSSSDESGVGLGDLRRGEEGPASDVMLSAIFQLMPPRRLST
jgi:hypothetical protein